MKKDSTTKLEEILTYDLNNYENMGFNDEGKAKALAIISREANIILAEEKEQESHERWLESQKKDEERYQLDKSMKLKELELKQLELEHKIDEAKFDRSFQIQKFEEERRHNKWQLILSAANIGGTFLLGIITKIMFTALTVNAQRHDYNDYQLESTSSKENRTNLLK